jgi:hypothetical protein
MADHACDQWVRRRLPAIGVVAAIAVTIAWQLSAGAGDVTGGDRAVGHNDEQSVDWEAALADSQRGWAEADRIANLATHGKADAKVIRERWKAFAAANPRSPAAARFAAGECQRLLEEGRFEELLVAVPAAVQAHPGVPGITLRAVSCLAQAAADQRASAEVKRRSIETLVPLAGHRVKLVQSCRGPLEQLDMPAVERLQLAERLEEACGPSQAMRGFRWRCIEAFSKSAAAAADKLAVWAAVERFLARYPAGDAGALEADAAERLLLKLDGSAEAGKKLADRIAAETRRNADLARRVASVKKALASESAEAVGEAARALSSIEPDWAAEPAWRGLISCPEWAAAKPAPRAALLVALFDATKPGQAQEDAVVAILRERADDARLVGLAIDHFAANTTDAEPTASRVKLLVAAADACSSNELAGRAARAAAAAADRVGLSDLAVTQLLEHGKAVWDSDRAAAIASLQSAAARWPAILEAAEAGWFLAFLQGRVTIEQPAAPRRHVPVQVASETPAVPAATTAPAPVVIADRDGSVCPEAVDTKTSLVAGRVARSGGTSIAEVTDGDPATAWTPPSLPAVLRIPLDRVTSLDRIRVLLTAPAYYTITLRDSAGRAVGRVERDWGFRDAMAKTAAHWPLADELIELTPTAHVASVELRVSESTGTVGVAELEAFATPYPLTALHVITSKDVPAAASRATVTLEADEPVDRREITASSEAIRGFPMTRWGKPWPRMRQPLSLNQGGERLGIAFGGDDAEATVSGVGRIRWRIDGGNLGEIAVPPKPAKGTVPVGQIGPGRHQLVLDQVAEPAARDAGGTATVFFERLSIQGRATVRPLVRFVAADGKAGEWITVPSDGSIRVPAGSAGRRMEVAACFDSRNVAGRVTATVRKVAIEFGDAAKETAAGTAFAADPPAAPESLAVAAAAAADGVVVFPKAGSAEELAAARLVADRTGLPLLPDDIGLNFYSWPVIAVGTPLDHRYCRQLLASHGLWSDERYLNSADGLVVVAPLDLEAGSPRVVVHVTGETPSAVAAAAAQLVAALPKRAATKGARLFAANSLETIYHWQLHRGRAAPESLDIRLGRGDRRSAQFGVAAEDAVAVEVACSELASDAGGRLPAPLVRPVGNYEWVPFFGDLRLPNLLLPTPRFELPARASRGVWLTAITRPDTPPGTYRGTVTVTSGSQKWSLPVRVQVEPVGPALPFGATAYSFAGVPRWFHPGTAAWKRAAGELAANEADQGVNAVSATMRYSMRPAEPGASDGAAVSVDFSLLDAEMDIFDQAYRDRGLSAPLFVVQMNERELLRYAKTLPSEGADQGTSAARRQFAEALARHLRSRGRAGRFVLKVGDEPADLVRWAEVARPYRDGGLRIMTAHNTSYPDMRVAEGIMNAWCPNYQHAIWHPFLRERQRQGDPLWWYECGIPATRLTGQPVDNLPFYWLTEKWKFDGCLNYAAMHASDYSMPVPFRYEHGMDHRMVFEQDGRLIETPRREWEGDGIRDLALLRLVRKQIEAIRDTKPDLAAAWTDRLDALIETVVPYRYGYPQDPNLWLATRNALYDLAVEAEQTAR